MMRATFNHRQRAAPRGSSHHSARNRLFIYTWGEQKKPLYRQTLPCLQPEDKIKTPLARICPRRHRSDVLHLPFNPFTAHPRVGRRLPGRCLNLITALEVHKGTESPPGERRRGAPVPKDSAQFGWKTSDAISSRAPLHPLQAEPRGLFRCSEFSVANWKKISRRVVKKFWTLRNSPLL